MSDNERQQKYKQLTKELLKRAKEGIHSEFQFLHNLSELHATKICIKAQTKLVKGFKRTAAACIKDYLKAVASGADELKLIISYREIKDCIKFYSDEINILKDMIKEYVCYIHSNHLLKTLMGINRPEEDKIDWRKLPVKLF